MHTLAASRSNEERAQEVAPPRGQLERQVLELKARLDKFQRQQIEWDEQMQARCQNLAGCLAEAGRQLQTLHEHRRLTNKNFGVVQEYIDSASRGSQQPAPVINVTVHEREPAVSVVNEIHPDDQARVTTVRRDAAGRIVETTSERKASGEVSHG